MSATFDHPGDLLSAYLDDELTPVERAAVEHHLESCATCRLELGEVGEARALLRGLGDVDVPFGFYERLLQGGDAALEAPRLGAAASATKGKRRFRFGLANIAATAACWLLVIGIVNMDRHDDSSVAASDVLAQTASMVPALGPRSLTPAPPAEQREAAAYDLPSAVATTFELVAFRTVGERSEALFSDGTRVLAVVVVPGRLEWERLTDARPIEVNGEPAWEVRRPDAEIILVQRPDVVVVVAGPPLALATDVAAADLDPGVPVDDGLVARLENAGRGLLDTFGLRG